MIARTVVVLAVVAAAAVLGRWWQSRQGRVRSTPATTDRADRIVAATLVSTPTCRSCPQVRTALDTVARASDVFRWDEVDATGAPDVLRMHDVRRAPTVLFRAADGRVVARAAGVMGATQVAEAVGVDLVTLA